MRRRAGGIEGMAAGIVAGGAVALVSQWPALRREGYGTHPASPMPWRRDPALRRILRSILPGVIGLAAIQISGLINTTLATSGPLRARSRG